MIKNIVPGCAALLRVSSQVRREAKTLFWRFSSFRLRPASVDCLNIPTCRQMRRILLEVIHPDRGAFGFAFDHVQFVEVMPRLINLPALEYIDLCIDAPSLRDCIPINRLGYCQEHKTRIASSDVLRCFAEQLCDSWGSYLLFRLHLTSEAELRTHQRVFSDYPSLRGEGNNTLNPCDDHLLGRCKTITCRLLHAIEKTRRLPVSAGDRLYFFRIEKWNEDTTIWEPFCPLLPLEVNLMDLKGGKDSRQSPVEEQLFDILYLSGPS